MASRPHFKIGKIFGRLNVIGFLRSLDFKHIKWVCLCNCGKIKAISSGGLNKGTKSCGCITREGMSERSWRHGGSKTKEFKAWGRMKERCYRPAHDQYHHYGGRGIVVCDRWRDSFENFLSDMGPMQSGDTVERVDTNGNYEPGNCKWAKNLEQQNNKRTNLRVNFQGITKTVAQWCRELGLKRGRIYHRLALGWSVDEAFLTPVIENKIRRR